MINWDAIREEWETNEITFKDLAEKYALNVSTVRSRKNREKWQRNATVEKATQRKKDVATEKAEKVKTEKVIKETVNENSKLTDKQKDFCIYYLKYFNATKAYHKAYGCDYESAMRSGSRLLRNVEVSNEIDRIKEQRTGKLKIGLQDILQKYIDIAFTDITDFMEFGRRETVADYDENGEPVIDVRNYVNFRDHEDVDGSLITEVRQGKDGVAIKLQDKMKALEMLTRFFEVLPESAREELQSDKTKAEIEFINARTGLIKGSKKDTSLIEALGLVMDDE